MARTTRRSTPRRTATPRSTRRRTRGGGALPLPSMKLGISPAVARSLLGIFLLALGAVLLIALLLPGQGRLTDWVRDAIVPFFGAGRWLLPFVLLVAGWYIEWGPGKENGAPWGRTLIGIALAYTALLGLFQLVRFSGPANTGGRIGSWVETLLVGNATSPRLLPVPAAFVILIAVLLIGLLLAFDLPLRQLLRPVTGAGRAVGTAFTDARAKAPEGRGTAVGPGRAKPAPDEDKPGRLSRGIKLGTAAATPGPGSGGSMGRRGQRARREREHPRRTAQRLGERAAQPHGVDRRRCHAAGGGGAHGRERHRQRRARRRWRSTPP